MSRRLMSSGTGLALLALFKFSAGCGGEMDNDGGMDGGADGGIETGLTENPNYILPATAMDDFEQFTFVVDDPMETIQAEVSLAVDLDGRIFACYHDLRTGIPQLRVSRSLDGGKTFEPSVQVSDAVESSGDPVIATDADGRVFVAMLDMGLTSEQTVLRVARSDDHGASFQLVAAVPNNSPPANLFYDKEWLTVDADGTVYLSVTEFDYYSGTARVVVAGSTDHGQTFSTTIPVSGDSAQFSQLATDRDHNLYVSWVDLITGRFYLRKSTDGGQSFSPARAMNDQDNRTDDIDSSLYVTPRGTVYLVWSTGAYHSWDDVWLARTPDGGETVEIFKISPDEQARRILPWLAADDTGGVYVFYLDSRDGGWKIMYGFSTDGGESFTGPAAITNGIFFGTNERGGDFSQWLGDYNQAVLREGFLYSAWTDTRRGNSDIWLGVDDLRTAP